MPVDPVLTKAGDLLKAGNKKEAKKIINQYLRTHPDDPIGWYGYSKCFTDTDVKKRCLERTLDLQPNFEKAKIDLDKLNSQINSDKPLTQSINGYSVINFPTDDIETQPKTDVQTRKILTTRKVANALNEDKQKFKQWVWVLWVLLIGLGILILFNPKNTKLLLWIIAVCVILRLALPNFFDKYSETKKKYRAYDKGARGEESIVNLLNTLGPDFAVWNDVMTQYGNIDHIVLCKNGTLFMIETKANSGTVDASEGILLLNGSHPKKDMISQCLRNTYSIKESLEENIGQSIWVNPILVFTNAFVKSGKPIKGVRVINKKYLLSTIQTEAKKTTKNTWLWEKRQELSIIFSVSGEQLELYQRAEEIYQKSTK